MNDNKTIAVNSLIIFVRLVLTSLLGILMSRIVLDALGASDYGLYNVVGGIVTLLNVFNTAMLSTTYRFIAVELGKNSQGNLNKVFNTSFIIHVGFALFIVIVGYIVGEWYLNNYLNVEFNKLSDAHFVLKMSLITTALSTLLIPYQGLITAYEKFNVLAIRDILTRLLLFIAVCFLLYSDKSRLRTYAWIQLGYNLLYNGSFYLYCVRNYHDITKFKPSYDRGLVKEMASFASWTLFGALATIGKNQGCVLLINFFFGSLANAAYAIAAQVEGFVQTFARSLNSASVPQITKNYSGGNMGRSMMLTSYISKYTFIIMAIVAFPVLQELDFLLGIWLKEVPDGAGVFCQLLLLGGLISTLGEGIPALVNATGNIRLYQVIFHTFTLLGLPIAWLFMHWGYNQYVILIVYCVIYLLGTFLRLSLLKLIYHFDIKLIINVSYIRIILISIPLVCFYVFYDSSTFSTIGHILGMVGSELYLLMTVFVLGLDEREKKTIRGIVISGINKIANK